MDMVIVNGSLITGDGITFLEKASVRIRGTKIVDVTPYQVTANEGDRIIDAGGAVVLPGIINAHAHGCIAGPSMPSGSLPLSAQDISYQRNRHLLSGTTTLLNVCGLATPDEIGSGALASHALDVQVSTAHTPSSLGAARVSDGAGLSAHHLSATIDDMLARGAKAPRRSRRWSDARRWRPRLPISAASHRAGNRCHHSPEDRPIVQGGGPRTKAGWRSGRFERWARSAPRPIRPYWPSDCRATPRDRR